MPYLYSTDTNLAPAQAGGQSFAGGQFTAARQSIIPEDAYGPSLNIDNDEYGNAITRRGSLKIGTSPSAGPIQGITTFYQTAATDQCTIASFNGLLYYYRDNNATWNALPVSGTWTQQTGIDKHVRFASLGGKLFVVNGVNDLFSISLAGAGVSEAGGTNVDPPGTSMTPSNPPVDICNHTNRLVVSDQKNNIYFSQFGNGSVGQWNRALWSIGIGTDNFKITGLLSWSNFDLLVMKEDSLWVVDCTPTYAVLDFTVKPIHKTLGCPAPRTACQVGTDILLLTRLGVIKLDRSMSTDATTKIDTPISKPIQDIINRINWSQVKDNASAFFFNNRYFLNVPLDADTTNVTTIVYNTVTDKWMGSWGKGMDIHCCAIQDSQTPSRMRFGRFDGNVYEWLDYILQANEVASTYQDNAVPYGSSLTTRAYDFGDPDSYKDLATLKLEFLPSLSSTSPPVDGLVDVGIRLDGAGAINLLHNFSPAGADQAILPNPSGGSSASTILPFYLPIPGIKPKKLDLSSQPPCLEVCAEINTASGRLCVRKVIFAAFVGSMGVETAG